MSLFKRIKKRTIARKFRVRNKIARFNTLSHKVVIFRSNKHIYAALVDVTSGKTLLGFSSRNVCQGQAAAKSCNNLVISKAVGEGFGKKCLDLGVAQLAFDRSGYLYHGKVAALADGIRSAGVSL